MNLKRGYKRWFKDLKKCLVVQGKFERSMVLRIGCIKLQSNSASLSNLS